jgi:predicted TIM-barrel fold metal-dependent hydrolase
VSLPQVVWDEALPPIQDAYYEPFWQIFDDLDLTLSIHAGWGQRQGVFQELAMAFTKFVVGSAPGELTGSLMEALAESEDSPLRLDMGPRRAVWQLMLGGVLDRHPNLRVALTEVRADWIPGTIAKLDRLAETTKVPMQLKPSEYYRRNVFATPSSIHRCEVEMRHEIGVDQMLFGVDYPHPEGTWPNTREWMGVALGDVPEHELRAILGENAIRAYSLDRAALEKVAARIGPEIADIVGEHTVPQARLEHWDARAGYSRGPEQPDLGVIESLFEEDLQSLAASS